MIECCISQLDRGIDESGNIIGTYSLATEQITEGRKREGDPYTLRDTAFYHDSYEVMAFIGGFTVDSDPLKEDGNFLDKLGIDEESIQGLTDGNLQIVIDEVKDLFPDEIRKFFDSIR